MWVGFSLRLDENHRGSWSDPAPALGYSHFGSFIESVGSIRQWDF